MMRLQRIVLCAVTLLIVTSGVCAVHGDEFFKQTGKTNNNVKIYVNSVEIVRNQDNFDIATPETSNEDVVEHVETVQVKEEAVQVQEEADQVQEEAVEQVETVQEEAVELQTPESSEEDEVQEDNIKAIENAPSTLEYGSMIGNLVCNDVGLNVPVYWSGQQSTIDRKNSAICDPYRNLPWNGPALLADHNTQDFDALYDMSVGQKVYIDTQWGTLEYTIDYVGHACCQSDYNHLYTDSGVDVTCTSEQLTLYTCYPRYSNAVSPDRYVVLATRTL